MLPAATTGTRMGSRCPLCGDAILDVGHDGRVVSSEARPIPLLRHGLSGEGYLVCDACAFLAQLPTDITLN
jgi:hypothetical protein